MNWLIKIACVENKIGQEEINTFVHPNKVQWLHHCVGIVNTDEEKIREIGRKSAVIKWTIKNPIVIPKNQILNMIEENQFPHAHLEFDYIRKNTTIVVRHEHTGSIDEKLPTERIERKIGSLVLANRTDLSVDLTAPENEYRVITWNNGSAMGILSEKISFDRIASRAPKNGPYFRGGGMKPRLCRTLVNLLYPLQGVVLDPFCGHGGILREIADLNSFAVGIEINKKLCRELLANNRHFGYDDSIAIIMGDSIQAPLRKFAYEQAITDPPYAIQTTTKGMDREILMHKWLEKQNKGLKLVFTTPNTMLPKIPVEWLLEVDEEDFVHKSLTRRIRRIIRK